jgi:hypothetical protein
MKTQKNLILSKTILALEAFSVFTNAFSFEVNPNKYFAYYKIPDKQYENLATYSPFIFLSHEKYKAKGIGKQYDARKAISFWPGSQQTRHECWTSIENNIVLICPIGQQEDGTIGNACIQISKSRFLNTKSLPQSANF